MSQRGATFRARVSSREATWTDLIRQVERQRRPDVVLDDLQLLGGVIEVVVVDQLTMLSNFFSLCH